jgi:transposase
LGVAFGIDAHKKSLFGAAVDALGRVVRVLEVDNSPAGHCKLLRWMESMGAPRTIGIEGTGHYGRALALALIAAGETVFEVPAHLTGEGRKRRPSAGKSDRDDAIAIARAVLRGDGLAAVRTTPLADDLKVLVDRRDHLKDACGRARNEIHGHLVVLRPGYHHRVPKLTARCHLAAVLKMLRGDHGVRAKVVRDLVAEMRRLMDQMAELERLIAAKVKEADTGLTDHVGVGILTAAKTIAEVGDVSAIRSKAAFAMLAGTAPLPASSGTIVRHRLNRGGNRQLNHAIHMIAVTRARCDARSREFLARRKAMGNTPKEAIRSLKRHISNELYQTLRSDREAAKIAS